MDTVWAILLGIFQNLVTYWFIYTLGGAVTTCLAIWAKIKENLTWPTTLIMGLVVATCLTVLYAQSAEWARDYFMATRTVEEQVKEWLDMPGFKVTRVQADISEVFRFTVELPKNTLPIMVAQLKEEPTIMRIGTALAKDQRMEEFFSKLDSSQVERVKAKMYLELLRLGVQYSTLDQSGFLLSIFDRITFDKTLTKRSFIRSIFNIQSAALAAVVVYRLEMTYYSEPVH